MKKKAGLVKTSGEVVRLDSLLVGDDEPELFVDFEQFLAAYSSALRSTQGTVLRLAWGIGKHVEAMLSAAQYGDHKIEELCARFELGKSSLYAYRQLNVLFSWSELSTILAPKGFSWKHLERLFTMDEDGRHAILEQVASGEMTVEEAMQALPSTAPVLPVAGTESSASGSEDTGDDVTKAALSLRRKAGKIAGILELLSSELDKQEELVSQLDVIADSDDMDDVMDILSGLKARAADAATSLSDLVEALNKI